MRATPAWARARVRVWARAPFRALRHLGVSGTRHFKNMFSGLGNPPEAFRGIPQILLFKYLKLDLHF